ncbi:MAG TPA: exodeoxyribonuclease III [Burkholderiaceae bacterium]|nr:exodeoxyribonuclease III [Burkholderiaceae bacterium]HPE02583.1 exodeoxyribonuclease III [Burkholderiaceae bacterium]HRZ01359.1 exodeoxyribonuclease III [Burkholderiaceae bacterium]
MAFTLATWNVNSLKVRLAHLLDWLAAQRTDVVCLQETKLTDEAFPLEAIAAAGYAAHYAGQKTYNGVAILSRRDTVSGVEAVQVNLPNFADEQRRLIAATLSTPLGALRVVNGYFPNGQAVGSDKYAYKLAWLAALTEWLKGEVAAHAQLALLGDYNIAPEPRDVHDPAAWEGQVLCSEPERAAFRALVALGLRDSFRLFAQPERSYTWWDYRNLAFRRKMGLRIDHILVSEALAARVQSVAIDVEPRRREQPSDHAPVIATLA